MSTPLIPSQKHYRSLGSTDMSGDVFQESSHKPRGSSLLSTGESAGTRIRAREKSEERENRIKA